MTNNASGSPLEQYRPKSHSALYFAVSKQRWSVFQKRVLQFWQLETSLSTRNSYTRQYYVPLLQRWLADKEEDIRILEIGSGPVCAAQYLNKGEQTYIDPLLDNYRRLFPGAMPEAATYITEMAENVELEKESYDVVLCLNTLSDVLNPELVLNKIERVLKVDGLFVVSMDLWPSWLARAHFVLSRLAPGLPRINRLYSYTHKGFVNSLSRHFHVLREERVGSKLNWLSLKQERMFVCEHLNHPKKEHHNHG